MPSYASSILIAIFGILGLSALQFGVRPDSSRVALLVPPRQGDGLRRAAATGLAIVDFHWAGTLSSLIPAAIPTLSQNCEK